VAEPISIAEARRRVLGAVTPFDGTEAVPLTEALGRVLARDLAPAFDVPPFDSSAMDGFAVVAGPRTELEIVGESRAGHPTTVAVEPGTAVRVSTGAVLPDGATAVVPVERSAERAQRVGVEASAEGDNMRRAGEDVPAGTTVLAAGTVLGPAEVGLAAAMGQALVPCAPRPRVAVVVTGDELIEPGAPLGPGQIYSSNGFALGALADRAGARVVARESVEDTPASTAAALARALESADVVCVSGGMSVGPHDHVRPALRELGVQEVFWGVRLRPGKPTSFGTRSGRLVFGLPGNPVSAMVAFTLFARPALAALQGADPRAPRVSAALDESVARHPAREQAVRVRLRAGRDGWHAMPTGAQGSHMLSSMLGADGLALVAPGEGRLERGERVEVELL
jgi:molybdopterin molybdotransferase